MPEWDSQKRLGLTNSAAIQGSELAHTNAYPIYDLLNE